MIDYKYIMYVYVMNYRKLYQKYKKKDSEVRSAEECKGEAKDDQESETEKISHAIAVELVEILEDDGESKSACEETITDKFIRWIVTKLPKETSKSKQLKKYKKDKEELKKEALVTRLFEEAKNEEERMMIVNIFTEKLIKLLPEETSRSKTILRRIKDN